SGATEGLYVTSHVYVKLPSPLSSSPRTLRTALVPVTGLGVTEAGVFTVGGWFVPTKMKISAVPETPGAAAVIVKGPPLWLPAVKIPSASIVPPPLALHVNVGCRLMGRPN